MTALGSGLYRPGTSLLHRSAPGTKLLALAVFAVITVIVDDYRISLGLLAGSVVTGLVSGLSAREVARVARGFLWLGLLLLAFQWWQNGWPRAVELTSELLALVIASSVLTATTSTDDMITTITRALQPFRRFGVSPDAVALAFSLAIRAMPLTLDLANETRDAARARGLGRNVRAYATPLVLRVVAHANDTGDALTARGLGDD